MNFETVVQKLEEIEKKPSNEWIVQPFPQSSAPLVASLHYIMFSGSEEKPIFCTRAIANFDPEIKPETLLGIALNPTSELKWNSSTVSQCTVISGDSTTSNSGSQTIYQQHKTLAAALTKRDLCFERHWDLQRHVIISCTTSKSTKHENGFSNAAIILSKISIDSTTNQIKWLWCFDFGGMGVHEKFVEAEKIKVAQRLSKIISLGLESCGKEGPVTTAIIPSALPTKSGSKYREYLSSVLTQEDDETPIQQSIAPSVSTAITQANTTTSSSNNSVVVIGCADCKKKCEIGKFCASCGKQLVKCCPDCFTVVSSDSSKFCSSCGKKLII